MSERFPVYCVEARGSGVPSPSVVLVEATVTGEDDKHFFGEFPKVPRSKAFWSRTKRDALLKCAVGVERDVQAALDGLDRAQRHLDYHRSRRASLRGLAVMEGVEL